MQSQLQWHYKQFDELSSKELYEILLLRSLVFVVEQNCVYLDLDGKDQSSYHLWASLNDMIVAYVRLLPPGLSYDEASIGRVITHPDHRKNGFGIDLMNHAIERTLHQFNATDIRISAQCYLEQFYGNLGFKIIGVPYLEDGIPHVEMLLQRVH
jgi:ElaA protein